MLTGIFRPVVQVVLAFVMSLSAALAQAECAGCLCPGNPCKLCPLPPSAEVPPVADEPVTCVKIRENAPAVSANTDPDAHYASLDKSIMECVRNGGDVLMNSRRNKEFPSKHYCKPYIAAGKANTDKRQPAGKN